MSEQSVGHAPPFYCPYCGEEDIGPYGESVGTWRCAACLRTFVLKLAGTGVDR